MKEPTRPRGLSRIAGSRPLRRRVLVFTEGTNTEPQYINALKRTDLVKRNSHVSIAVSPEHGSPMNLVQAALRTQKGNEYDDIWCLFDVEAPVPHGDLVRALELAKRKNLNVALSNPCFELWLYLHDFDHNAYITTDNMKSIAQQLPELDGENLVNSEKLTLRRNRAIQRAEALRLRHIRNQTKKLSKNPSTDVDLFIRALEG